MRVKVGEKGVGGNNESWYYVEKDEVNGVFFYIHEWNNMNHQLKINEGESKIPLEEAVGKPFYKEAKELSTSM
jgi:outer membrane protein assembly factor BamE (lipoprotein component of BamABCDE complex)